MKPNAENYDPRPEYLAELIGSTGLSQAALGQLLGVTDKTLRNWLSGRNPFPYTAQFALECLVLSV
jgi:transcriptional regulator with XRE-family HTH domain